MRYVSNVLCLVLWRYSLDLTIEKKETSGRNCTIMIILLPKPCTSATARFKIPEFFNRQTRCDHLNNSRPCIDKKTNDEYLRTKIVRTKQSYCKLTAIFCSTSVVSFAISRMISILSTSQHEQRHIRQRCEIEQLRTRPRDSQCPSTRETNFLRHFATYHSASHP